MRWARRPSSSAALPAKRAAAAFSSMREAEATVLEDGESHAPSGGAPPASPPRSTVPTDDPPFLAKASQDVAPGVFSVHVAQNENVSPPSPPALPATAAARESMRPVKVHPPCGQDPPFATAGQPVLSVAGSTPMPLENASQHADWSFAWVYLKE